MIAINCNKCGKEFRAKDITNIGDIVSCPFCMTAHMRLENSWAAISAGKEETPREIILQISNHLNECFSLLVKLMFKVGG